VDIEEIVVEDDDPKWYKRVITSKDELYIKQERDKISNIYYGRDTNEWTVQVQRTNFIQHGTTPEGLSVLMLKARATLKINLNHLRYVVMNMDIRK